MKMVVPAASIMGFLFTFSILLGMLTSYILPEEYKMFGEETENASNAIFVVALILIFTAVILIIAKFGKMRLLHIIIMSAVFMSVIYVLYPIFSTILGKFNISFFDDLMDISFLLAFMLAVSLLALLIKYPEWYVIDATGVLLAAGISAIFGISLETSVIILLLVIAAIYDYLSVYKTKHMVDLADNVTRLRLPILLVVPRKLPYTYLKGERIKDNGERDAMLMGLGDIIFPGCLSISALTYVPKVNTFTGLYANVAVASFTLLGIMISYSLLVYLVLKGKPHAGLPFLNTGAIVGYIAGCLITLQYIYFPVPTWGW